MSHEHCARLRGGPATPPSAAPPDSTLWLSWSPTSPTRCALSAAMRAECHQVPNMARPGATRTPSVSTPRACMPVRPAAGRPRPGEVAMSATEDPRSATATVTRATPRPHEYRVYLSNGVRTERTANAASHLIAPQSGHVTRPPASPLPVGAHRWPSGRSTADHRGGVPDIGKFVCQT